MAKDNRNIIVTYTAMDNAKIVRHYKYVEIARLFAYKMVGRTPEISWHFHYAVSSDGIGKVTVTGASIFDLFPDAERPTS